MTLRSRREVLALAAGAAVAGAAGVFTLAGCGGDEKSSDTTPSTPGSSPDGTTAPTNAPITTTAAAVGGTIGFAWTDTAIEVYKPLIAGAKEEAAARGYELLESNNGGDVTKQLADVSTWVGQGITGVTILPLDPAATTNTAKEAQAAGVIVVGYSDKIEGADGSTTFDHVQGGTALGEHASAWINDNLGGSAKIGLLVIDEMTTSEVVGRVKAVSAAEALPAVQSMLQADPDMNVVICVADDGCTGASQAYKAAGIDPEGIYIAGFDGALGALNSVKEGGYVKADAALDLKEIGRSVVYVIDNIKNGVEPKDKLHPYVIVDATSGQALDDLIASFG